jgi:hypothetical protein
LQEMRTLQVKFPGFLGSADGMVDA